MMIDVKLSFETSTPGRRAWTLPESTVPATNASAYFASGELRVGAPDFPELSEVDVVRHFTRLSTRNHGVDTGFYPLGSCTMKYNPKINEDVAALPGFTSLHPSLPEYAVPGAMAVFHELTQSLCEITGMDAFTLQPAAGAHGELTAMFIIRQYLRSRGESGRTKVLVPTSAHGTNPASAAMAGFETVTIPCNDKGLVDLDQLRQRLGSDTAALMLTNPNTLGLFEAEIEQIAALVHQAGGLLYYDGANLNAIMGLIRPGDMGFDVIHLNLHKTFSTPHGGGGPGSGPVGVTAALADFLPFPVVANGPDGLYWDMNRPKSIGRIQGFYGNFGVLLKALVYIRALGGAGLSQVSRDAVLNANYLRAVLGEYYHIPYNRPCMHEFVIAAEDLPNHIRALDIAKRLIEFGYHPPTIYFPLIVHEALMIEPTETEGKETLDQFAAVMVQIIREAGEHPELLTEAPRTAAVRRVDEASAARTPKLRWQRPAP